MSALESVFTKDDITTLIQSVDDWEMVGNEEYNILMSLKKAPMPPEDHPAYDYYAAVKDAYADREKEIRSLREIRQEKAVFLKAKLFMVKRDIGVTELFDMASVVEKTPVKAPEPASRSELEDLRKFQQFAKTYMKEIGCLELFEKALESEMTAS